MRMKRTKWKMSAEIVETSGQASSRVLNLENAPKAGCLPIQMRTNSKPVACTKKINRTLISIEKTTNRAIGQARPGIVASLSCRARKPFLSRGSKERATSNSFKGRNF